jgi:hypothetical protein
MSRYYEMGIEILRYDPEKEDQIKKAAENEWPLSNWWSSGDGTMQASAPDWLCGGESEEQFTERLSVAIWRANGGFCEVVVNATYLEELPYESHTLDQDDYDRLIQPNTGETKNEDHADCGS